MKQSSIINQEEIKTEIDDLIEKNRQLISAKQKQYDTLSEKLKIGNVLQGWGIICSKFKLVNSDNNMSVYVLVHPNLKVQTRIHNEEQTIPDITFGCATDLAIIPLDILDELECEPFETYLNKYKTFFIKDFSDYLTYTTSNVLNNLTKNIEETEERLKTLKDRKERVEQYVAIKDQVIEQRKNNFETNIAHKVGSFNIGDESLSFDFFIDENGNLKTDKYVHHIKTSHIS